MFESVRIAVNVPCLLGEGLRWEATDGGFYFVDIEGRKVYFFNPDSSSYSCWDSPERIGWILKTSLGFVAGLQSGVAIVSLSEEGAVDVKRWIARDFQSGDFMRLNDAKVDHFGRIWMGSMRVDCVENSIGALFLLDVDGSIRCVDHGYWVPNGPAISPDGLKLLHSDSPRGYIYSFDLCDAGRDALLNNKVIWRHFDTEDGAPDGMTFDACGCLWVAHWGAGQVRKYSPDGVLLRSFCLPAKQVTSVAFGGVNFDRLFVTSAAAGLSEVEKQEQPFAGAVFELLGHSAVGLNPPQYIPPV